MKEGESKLRIAYFIDRLIKGGTELQLCEQINKLHEKGIEQELFCLYKTQEHDQIAINCKVNILEIRKLISLQCFVKILKLIGYLRRRRFTIIQTYFFDSTMIGVLSGRMAGGAKIISCRRDLGFWYTPELIMSLKILNKMTDRILVNSESAKQSVVRKERVDPKDIDVIPNGIDLTRFSYSEQEKNANRQEFGLKADECCAGIIANMSRRVKRVDIFLKAAEYALQKRRDLKFIVFGEGELKGELIRMTEEAGIQDHVIFVGQNTSRHKVLSSIDIGILSSDSEAFSNAIMEYMASGLPVIATAVGGNLELVEHNFTGYLTKPGDAAEIGEKILILAGDIHKREEFGKNGRKRVEKYNWDKIIERVMEYYEERVIS